MGLLRSQDVDLFEIVIPKDNDWEIMNELGKSNFLHFIDLNKGDQAHHLRYFNYVRRAEETEKLIEEMEVIYQRYRVEMRQPANLDEFMHNVQEFERLKKKGSHLLFAEIEHEVRDKSKFLKQQVTGLETMILSYRNLLAKMNVLSQASRLFSISGVGSGMEFSQNQGQNQESAPELYQVTRNQKDSQIGQSLLGDSGALRVSHYGGTIKKSEQMSFKKLLFRATRGKAYVHFFDYQIDPQDRMVHINDHNDRLVYIIVFEQGLYLNDKIRKICSSSTENTFELERNKIQSDLVESIRYKENTKAVIQETKRQLKDFLLKINYLEGSEYSLIQIFKWYATKERSIYAELNKLRVQDRVLTGYFWCPAKFRTQLEQTISDIRSQAHIDGPHIHLVHEFDTEEYVRPTFIETNELTWPFQEIVNTYSIPQYKEINPSVFAIVSFPFLFGVMFGDVMHGTLLIIFSTILCFSDRKPGTAFGELGKIRYLLLLMGFFSCYCGFIYNDFTSIPLKVLQDTCYNIPHDHKSEVTIKDDCIYKFGVDPSWYLGRNELAFMNSLKMKLSVILGVAQMAMGVIMKALNAKQFQRPIDFYFEFVPQIVLLLAMFGFMDLLIIVKWLTNYNEMEGAKPPSVITSMITMFLGLGEQGDGIKETELLPHQPLIMKVLVLISLICVPTMLFVKPIIENNKNKAKKQHDDHYHKQSVVYAINPDQPYEDDSVVRDTVVGAPLTVNTTRHAHHHGFGDLFIHQLIETIEFVLGTVSNTASYLRLWALSLAHGQLAKVFFDNTIKSGLQSKSFITLFLGYFVFLAFTISVLMMMDLMEAFLHTLRLHWVEFQNKFYKGGGHRFAPFSIETVLYSAAEQSKAKLALQEEQMKRSQINNL